jgi:hypothetical protein
MLNVTKTTPRFIGMYKQRFVCINHNNRNIVYKLAHNVVLDVFQIHVK